MKRLGDCGDYRVRGKLVVLRASQLTRIVEFSMHDHLWPRIVRDLAETQQVEYKSPAPCDKIIQKLMKAAIAMANTSNGGVIVVGVKRGIRFEATGLNEELLNTYDTEALQTELVDCAVPRLRLTVQAKYDEDRAFVVISVHPFDRIPHLSIRKREPTKQGVEVGRVYYRNDKPESHEVDSNEWVELMESTSLKGFDSRLEWLRDIGCGLGAAKVVPPPTDLDKFRSQMEDQPNE